MITVFFVLFTVVMSYVFLDFKRRNPSYSFFKNFPNSLDVDSKYDRTIEGCITQLLSTGEVTKPKKNVLSIKHNNFNYEVQIRSDKMTVIFLDIEHIMCDEIPISAEMKKVLKNAKSV